MRTVKESWLESVRAHAWRMRAAMEEAARVWDATDVQARDRGKYDKAITLSEIADRRLAEAEGLWSGQKLREEAADRYRRARVPPSLQALVLAHGTYDKITADAWAKFDQDMEMWKVRI